jgi:hypothetical protein
MLISELITELEKLKEEHGDLPVMQNTGDGEYCFPYSDVNNVTAFLNEEVWQEDDFRKGEILNFIALDYY